MDKNNILNEGGKAIKSASPIRGDFALVAANQVIEMLKAKYPKNNFATLGSTGKKGSDQNSGDIDIAVDIPIENAEEIVEFIKNDNTIKSRLNGNEFEFKFMKGLKILSFGFPWTSDKQGEGSHGVVQCDLMFVPNVNIAKYFYYSPDFTKKQSKFKGLVRNIFMIAILKNIPVKEENNTTFSNGAIKDLWKYTIKPQEGIVLLHQSYEGKKGQQLKSKHTIKEDTKVILDDPSKFTQFFMGPKATDNTISSFEEMWKYVNSNDFPWKDQRDKMIKDFIEDLTNENTKHPEIVDSVKEYINDNSPSGLSSAFRRGMI